MVAYDLIDPNEFVGYRAGLQVMKARKKDEANPSIKGFTTNGSNLTQLKVFNGTIIGSSLRKLMAELMHKKLWVNRDGYCYMQIPGSRSTRPPQPTKFIRLNDLFNWEDYADVPSGETFNPTPSTTVWNRLDTSTGDTRVDYDKLDSDLKQATDDKKKVEEDKKKAEDEKKKAEEDKKKAEDDKKRAEKDKKRAEEDKKKAEDDKKRAEEDKKKAEDDKKRAEEDKKKAEEDKRKAEDDKKRAEEDKKKAEEDKKKAEDDKKRAEIDKQKAEDDKKKAENDKKKAEDDKKRAEDAKKKAENDKKKAEMEAEKGIKDAKASYEDKLNKVNNDIYELRNRIARMKTLWDNAIETGCLPLHSSKFSISKTPKPRQSIIFSKTWMAKNCYLTSLPATFSGYDETVPYKSLVIYNANEYLFEKHFWWIGKMYFREYPGTNYLIAFSCNGLFDKSFDREVFADNMTCGTHQHTGLSWDVDTIVIRRI